jgi:hypothetical protein
MTDIVKEAREVADWLDGNRDEPAFAGPKVRAVVDEVESLRAENARLREGEARNAALEEAAKWHDTRAHDTPDAFEMEFHEVSARTIRSMKTAQH